MAATTLDRETPASLPASYFDAVDRQDPDGVVRHLAPEATLTVQTDNVTFTGPDEIRRMFSDFCNFFDVNESGTFDRVIIWMAGTNPLE